MNIQLQKSKIKSQQSAIQITGSKSESNRLLIIQGLFEELEIENLSNSDDTQVLQKALHSSSDIIDIHHAGTAMRFLTAYYSIQENREVVLTGSSRMKERPIGVLVDGLKMLGADISYEENEGFPPLRIKGKQLLKSEVSLKANVSSQFISALLLIGTVLENGLALSLEGKITSVPYINMTLSLLEGIGVKTSFEGNVIKVLPKIQNSEFRILNPVIVESDWSSASYFYSLIALSEIGTSITLSSYKETSLQGDSALAEIYEEFGVETAFEEHSIVLRKSSIVNGQSSVKLELNNSPDIAQTIAVTSFGLGISCDLYGLHTLKIKETDRLEALKIELEKLGASVSITNESLHLKKSNSIKINVSIDTYQDHRMAMAFAPLALKTSLEIKQAEVVSKSFPSFWDDLKTLGIQILKI
ncbi:MAG: 3-phosphoshikimate 1-carboxyvinyltransferase [Flavobacteriaceae bacterium]|nr:3-phosphoshikimate 1-carboxyvinyltransferase [Flavobacteriaceae bacterium]